MLALSHRPQELASWFQAPNSSSTDIATEAYTQAVQVFKTELSQDKESHVWIESHVSMDDVRQAVAQAQKLYDARSQKTAKPRKWIDRFAASLMAYSGVLDSLSQADPVHAGLVWGAMKFVFLGVVNHSQMVLDLSKALSKIGEALPRIQLEGALYQSPWMRDAIARLYANILLFLRHAVQWYTAKWPRRAIYSISRPLVYKDIITEMAVCTEAIEAIASTSSRAELRGLTITSHSSHQEIQRLTLIVKDQSESLTKSDQRMQVMQSRMEEINLRSETVLRQIMQMATNTRDLNYQIYQYSDGVTRAINHQQFQQILSALKPDVMPDDVLRMCESSKRRRIAWQQPGRDTAFAMQRLQTWANAPGSSMLMVTGGRLAETRTKDMALEVVALLRSTSFPVFWSFNYNAQAPAVMDLNVILRGLVYQAMRQNPYELPQDQRASNAQAFQEPHTAKEWATLATSLFTQISRCFVVVDLLGQTRSEQGEACSISAAVQIFSKIFQDTIRSAHCFKLMLVAPVSAAMHTLSGSTNDPILVNLNPPLPISRRSRATRAPNVAKGRFKTQLRPRLVPV